MLVVANLDLDRLRDDDDYYIIIMIITAENCHSDYDDDAPRTPMLVFAIP